MGKRASYILAYFCLTDGNRLHFQARTSRQVKGISERGVPCPFLVKPAYMHFELHMTASFGAHLREADILIHCQESNYMSRVKFKPGNLICGVYPLILAFVSCSIA